MAADITDRDGQQAGKKRRRFSLVGTMWEVVAEEVETFLGVAQVHQTGFGRRQLQSLLSEQRPQRGQRFLGAFLGPQTITRSSA